MITARVCSVTLDLQALTSIETLLSFAMVLAYVYLRNYYVHRDGVIVVSFMEVVTGWC